MGSPDDDRRQELAKNLSALRQRLDMACAAAGRSTDDVAVVAVTKTYPATDVIHLAELGIREVGENRDREAAEKAAEVARASASVRWHFVGQLQRNKCRSVVTYADVVESVDDVRLVDSLAEAARRYRDRPLDVLVQVSIDADPARGGAFVASDGVNAASDGGNPNEDRDLAQVLARVARSTGLTLRGLMAVAPLEWEPRRAYERLAAIAAKTRGEYPHADVLSAGMSGDFEHAIVYGATHIRVGSALLGNRATLM